MNEPIASVPAKLRRDLDITRFVDAEGCGAGGHGVVKKLVCNDGRVAAVKRVTSRGPTPEARMMLAVQELKCWYRVSHRHVLPLWGVIKWGNEMYLVSPFVQRGSMLAYIEANESADRIEMLRHAAAGLTFIHSQGFIHGDIKPDNVLISDRGFAMICDFGLSRPTHENTQADLHGHGTLRFMSPELLYGRESKTFHSDVWAYGMTVYQTLSRCIPYQELQGVAPLVIAVCVKRQQPPCNPPHSPTGVCYAQIWDIARQCWEVDPGRRSTMAQIHAALMRLDDKDYQGSVNRSVIHSEGYSLFYLERLGLTGLLGCFAAVVKTLCCHCLCWPRSSDQVDAALELSPTENDGDGCAADDDTDLDAEYHRIDDLIEAGNDGRRSDVEPETGKTPGDDASTSPGPAEQNVTHHGIPIDPLSVHSIVDDSDPVIAQITLDHLARGSNVAGSSAMFACALRIEHPTQPNASLVLKELPLLSTKTAGRAFQRRVESRVRDWLAISAHPNLELCLGAIASMNDLYLVFPDSPHVNLKEHLIANPHADRRKLLYEALTGLTHLHENGIVHGDIRAANVFVSESPNLHAFLSDFGLSERPEEFKTLQFDEGSSVRWWAPELLQPASDSEEPLKTPKTDMWACGLTVYEVYTGNPPFHWVPIRSVVELARVILRPLNPITEWSPPVAGESRDPLFHIAESCCVYSPRERMHSSDALSKFRALLDAAESNLATGVWDSASRPGTSGPPTATITELPAEQDLGNSSISPAEAAASRVDDGGPTPGPSYIDQDTGHVESTGNRAPAPPCLSDPGTENQRPESIPAEATPGGTAVAPMADAPTRRGIVRSFIQRAWRNIRS